MLSYRFMHYYLYTIRDIKVIAKSVHENAIYIIYFKQLIYITNVLANSIVASFSYIVYSLCS